MSCGGGSSPGTGVLRIAGRKIRFSFSEVRGPGVAAVSLQGKLLLRYSLLDRLRY